MREIKFRMWHKKSKKMYDVEKINIKDKLLNMWNSHFYSSSLFNFEEVELMQYTGLKDKNDVEIYEGDILRNVYYKYSNDENGNKGFKEEILKVVYKGCGFIYELIKINELENYLGEDGDDFIQVIGNIYENPELLEEE